jgi:hypothetical protein
MIDRIVKSVEELQKFNLSKDYIKLIWMCQVLLNLWKEVEYDLKY